jgi:hypothetical protein
VDILKVYRELKCKILRLVWGVGFSMLYLIAFTHLELPNVWLQAIVLEWVKIHLWMKFDVHVHKCLPRIVVRNSIPLMCRIRFGYSYLTMDRMGYVILMDGDRHISYVTNM